MKGEEVHTSFPDRYTGPGGRNRLRGGDTGTSPKGASGNTAGDLGALGSEQAGKNSGDALAGHFTPEQVRSAAVHTQGEVKAMGSGLSSKSPFDPTIITEREKFQSNSGTGNSAVPGSQAQGPDGQFGNIPGVKGS